MDNQGLGQIKRKQKTLDSAEITQRLQELEQIKSNLLDTVTHEFSTPISILNAYIEMFLNGRFDSSQPRCKEGLRSMKNAITRLERLVMNLLTLSRGKSKKLVLDYEQVFLQDLISDAVSQFREEIHKKGITVVFDSPPDLPGIWADPSKLSIALMNLLDNSIKFNKPRGFIRITLIKLNLQVVGITIADTGNGIPEDKIDEIFDPFTQVDMSSTREYQGTGLGLPVAKTIIESHGGRLTVRSKLGKGSTFMMIIPCEKPMGRSISVKKD
jgi:signal transduction histidine kinase